VVPETLCHLCLPVCIKLGHTHGLGCLHGHGHERDLKDEGKFTYGGFYGGAKNWGGVCDQADKTMQTPIAISRKVIDEARAAPTDAFKFFYKNFTGASVKNTGHGFQVNVGAANYVRVGADRWNLLQYHFHTPSEHTIQGMHTAMECHFVHQHSVTGQLAVIGVMMKADMWRKASSKYWSSALAQGLDMVPKEEGDVSDSFTLQKDTFSGMLRDTGALPKGSTGVGSGLAPSVHYDGSLTTPPCTTGVSWYVLIKASYVGANQVLRFQKLLGERGTNGLGENNRPIQPRNKRLITVNPTVNTTGQVIVG